MEWQSNQRKGRVTDASTSPSKDDLLEESQRIPTAKRNLFADGAVGIWAKCISLLTFMKIYSQFKLILHILIPVQKQIQLYDRKTGDVLETLYDD